MAFWEHSNIQVIKKFLLFPGFILLAAGIFWLSQWSVDSKTRKNAGNRISKSMQLASGAAPLTSQQEPQLLPSTEELSHEESSTELQVKSALSLEFGGGVWDRILYEKSKNTQLPIASLTKLMTALIVLERYQLTREIVISKEAMERAGEQGNLKEGERISAGNLLHITLIESSNRAAFALSEAVGQETFIGIMNEKARELGLLNTHFYDTTGLTDQNYSTVEDLAILARHLFLNYPLFRNITGLSGYDLYLSDGSLHHRLQSTNELLGQYGIIGGKTGYTVAAGGCFMVIQRMPHGNYVLHIILGAGNRVLEMKKLINKAIPIYE